AHATGDLRGIRSGLRHIFFWNGNAVGVADDFAFRGCQTRAFVRFHLIEDFADGIFIGHWHPPITLWHLVCQQPDCQDKPLLPKAEKSGSLDILASGMPKIFRYFCFRDVPPRGDLSAHSETTKAPLTWPRPILQLSELPRRPASRTRPMKP